MNALLKLRLLIPHSINSLSLKPWYQHSTDDSHTPPSSNVLQLHHVHGSVFCGAHRRGAQLPPPHAQLPCHAELGKWRSRTRLTRILLKGSSQDAPMGKPRWIDRASQECLNPPCASPLRLSLTAICGSLLQEKKHCWNIICIRFYWRYISSPFTIRS